MPYPANITHQMVVDALRPSRSLYPNAEAVAYFRPNSLTLHFERMSRETYKSAVENRRMGASRSHLEVVAHELTHWSDQVSTVWGQDYIVRVFQGYAAATLNREELFFRAIDLFDEERRILMPLYYHVVADNTRRHDIQKPWRIEFSCGQEFAPDGHINPARPLFFVKFADNETDDLVARQPITVGGLLETTATWSELRAGMDVIASMPEDERQVEQALWASDRLGMLYDPTLTVYTAPAHMLARFTGTTDLLQTYERGAAIAYVALNLTSSHFQALRHPEAFYAFGDRRAAFVHAENRGYIFAALARHAEGVATDQPLSAWLAEVLDRSGLPSIDLILHAAYQNLEVLARGLTVPSHLDEVRDYILEIGRHRFLKQAESAFRGSHFDPLGADGPMPLMFDCNCNLFGVGTQTLDLARFDPEAMHHAELKLRGFTTNLLQGCRGFDLPET